MKLLQLLLFICVLLLLAACESSETIIDPVPPDIDQDYLDPGAQERNLFVEGAVESGVVAILDDHSPFIIFSLADNNFRAYLTEQGVSESEFLASPDLRGFYEAHVIGDASGLIDRVYESETPINAKTFSGGTVTLESRDNEVGNAEIFVEGRKTRGAINENNTNYDFVIDRPLIDFPLE